MDSSGRLPNAVELAQLIRTSKTTEIKLIIVSSHFIFQGNQESGAELDCVPCSSVTVCT